MELGRPRVANRYRDAATMTLRLDIVEELGLALDFTDVWRSRLEVAWEGRVLFVVSREGLIAMKRLAGRPQDLADIAALGGPRAD